MVNPKFQLNFNGQILNPPKNQLVAIDSRFFWYDAVRQRVVGYDLFFSECYLAEAHTHDHGVGDSKPRLAFISGGDSHYKQKFKLPLSPPFIKARRGKESLAPRSCVCALAK